MTRHCQPFLLECRSVLIRLKVPLVYLMCITVHYTLFEGHAGDDVIRLYFAVYLGKKVFLVQNFFNYFVIGYIFKYMHYGNYKYVIF